MKINKIEMKGQTFTIKQIICLIAYYGLLRYLPQSKTSNIVGRISKKLRYYCCKNIFKKCGKNVNIERLAKFGSGVDIEIGENSGLGINCFIPSRTKIGRDVMMGPNCYIFASNHGFERTDIPMMFQGETTRKTTVIEDDVWIGRNVTMTPGRTIKKGSIIGACCLLSKDFPEYSVVGGNPSRLIKFRK